MTKIFRWKKFIGFPSFCTHWRGTTEHTGKWHAENFKINNLYFVLKVIFAALNHKREEVFMPILIIPIKERRKHR